MELKKRENIGWIDLLRVIACFFVVFSHCCDGFVGQFDVNREAFLTGTFFGSFARPCVPLFVMMSGVLLLPTNMGMKDFYHRRVGRILVPLVFWSVLLPVLFFVYMNFINPTTQNPLVNLDNHTFSATWNKICTFIFNFNFDTVPLWYLYMLVGLYLIIPILDGWLRQASRQEIKLFLYVWGISLLLPYVKMVAPLLGYAGNYGNRGILGVCDWNDYGTFYYVAGFIGYLVLAHYLVRFPLDWGWKRMLWTTIPMFVTGFLITSLGFVLTQEYFPGNYAYLEIVWYFAGINVFMMTFPVFVIVQKLNIASSKWLSRLASLTLGVYLCHYIFVYMAYDVFNCANLPFFVRIICMACASFVVSVLVAWGMGRIKFINRVVK